MAGSRAGSRIPGSRFAGPVRGFWLGVRTSHSSQLPQQPAGQHVARLLALGQIGGGSAKALLRKELSVAAINGLLWALVVAAITLFWFGNPLLSLVIALAMLFNQLCAALAGVTIPLLLKKLSIDPALAGSVILTTITDVVGFFVFLGLGALILL